MKKTIGLTLTALMFGAVFFGALSINVSAEAELPVWQVGDGWWFENTVDFTELQAEIDAGMAELPPGIEADITVGGGIGIYFGVEVVDTAYDFNGYNCYKVDFTGAVGIDFGLEASVNGEITEELMSIEIDATGQLVIVGEANLVGSLYFTVDELAFAGGDFTFTAEATGDLLVDAYVNMFIDTSGFGGTVISEEADIYIDASAAVENVLITGSLTLDPPIDFLDFPIFEGDEWEVPVHDTDWTASLVGSGTITVDAEITGIPEQPDIHEVTDLGVEIGTNTESGVFDNFYSRGLRCVAVYGDNYIIETDMGEFFNYYDWGTRQYGIDPLDYVGDVVPSSAGIQYSESEGFITGVTVDGEVMTETSDKASVEGAASDPLGTVQQETGGHGSVGERGGIFTLLLIGIIVIVIVLVLVATIAGRRRKKGPEEMYGAPPPQQAAYQQPPPPPPPPPEQETVVQDDQTLVQDDQTLVQ